MQSTTVFFLASLFTAIAVPAPASEKPESAAHCWQSAFEAGDVDAVAQCYASDAQFWSAGSPIIRGRDAIRSAYAGFFAGNTVKRVKITETGGFENSTEAASWGTVMVVSVSRKDGTESIQHGRYTDMSRKIDGRWVYIVEHSSVNPQPTSSN